MNKKNSDHTAGFAWSALLITTAISLSLLACAGGPRPLAQPEIQEVSLKVAEGSLYGAFHPSNGADRQRSRRAVIIIPGSGPTDRDGNSPLLAGPNDSLLQLGLSLAAAGHPVLRIDKRGVGQSYWLGMREEDLSIDGYAADIAAWGDWLLAKNDIEELAIIGHSEGALVGMLASQEGSISRLVLLTPLAKPLIDTLLQQLAGAPQVYIDAVKAIYQELAAGRFVDSVPAELSALFRPSVQPYLMSMIRHDPQLLLPQLPVRPLVIAGGRDLQIELADVRRLAASRSDSLLIEIPEMNHVLKTVQDDPNDNFAAYSSPDYPLAEGLVDGILDYLSGR